MVADHIREEGSLTDELKERVSNMLDDFKRTFDGISSGNQEA